MTKPAFSITSASIITVLGAIGTAVAALVPNWSHETQAIVATLGAIVTAVFPIVNALHYTAANKAGVVVNPAPVIATPKTPDVAGLVKTEVAKVDLSDLVKSHVNEVLSRGLVTGPPAKPVAALVPVEPELKPDPPAAA